MEEKLEEIQKKKQQLIEREKLIRNKIANQDRKDRTRRLIQIGAIVEKHLPITSTFDAEALAEYFDKHPNTLAEVSQYILEKAPFIQTLRGKGKISPGAIFGIMIRRTRRNKASIPWTSFQRLRSAF